MTVSSPAITYENFDECSMAVEEIQKNHNKLSLDEPFYYEYSSIYFQKKFFGFSGEYFFLRSKDNNLLVESLLPNLDLEYKLAPMTEITRINGIEVNKLSDEDINEIYEQTQGDEKLHIQYKNNTNQLRSIVLDRWSSTAAVTIIPTISSITKVDSGSSSYDANLKNHILWNNDHLKKIFSDIFEEIKKTKEYINTPENERGTSIVCSYNQKQWNDMNLWTPELTYVNLLKNDYEKPNRKYNIEFNNNIFPDEEKEVDKDALSIYLLDNKIGKFRHDFKFNAFPFDKQKLAFSYIISTSASEIVYPILEDTFLYSSNYKNLKFNDWTTNEAPNYKYFKYNDPVSYGEVYGVEISLDIERNFEYYLLKIFFPILIILIVAWSCFWVSPKELEARLTVSIVCLLSLIAYTFVIDKDLPKLAYFTIMDYAVLLSYAFSTIPTFESIFVNRIALKNLENAKNIDSKFLAYTPVLYISLLIVIFFSYTHNSENVIQALT